MEEEIIEEQPKDSIEAQTAAAEEEIKNDGAKELTEGSSFGKFKNAESLLEAYNNLEAEFTRKSQKLSETAKQLSEYKENAEKKPVPLYETDTWEKSVETFFKNNPSAKKYASEISERVLNDNELQISSQPLELAWAKILNQKFSQLDKTIEEDEFFKEHIFGSKNITEQIIKNYLQGLKEKKVTPVISTHTGSGFSLAPKNKPNSLEEAKVLAEAFFKI